MIVVDTSVWIAAFRSGDGPDATTLRALLEEDEVALPVPLRVEILSGASRADGPLLGRLLSALPMLYPTDDTWQRIGPWLERATAAGDHFGMGDLLIAALAAEVGAMVWSHDRDFGRMRRLKFVELYEPPVVGVASRRAARPPAGPRAR